MAAKFNFGEPLVDESSGAFIAAIIGG